MMVDNQELIQNFIEESLEQLSCIKNTLLEIEKGSLIIKLPLLEILFRNIHSIHGGAGFIGLKYVQKHAQTVEEILGMILSNDLPPNSVVIRKLSRNIDTLIALFHDVDQDTCGDSDDVVSDLLINVDNRKP